MQQALAIGATVVFVLVHLFGGKLRFLGVTPRSRWLSIAGGVSVAYVFLHLLPEVGEGQRVLAETAESVRKTGRHVYLVALAGLVAFYGLEHLALRSSDKDRDGSREAGTTPGTFAVHIGSFALYNALIGYLLLHRDVDGAGSLALFALAMALHFLVNDHGLLEHHKHRYNAIGRWLLSAAVVLGLLLGLWVDIPEATIALLMAFLAGGVVLNVIKEELPRERESRFSAFVAGAAVYSALLLVAA